MITLGSTPALLRENLPADLQVQMDGVRQLGNNKLSEVLIGLLGCPYTSHFRPNELRNPPYYDEHAAVIEDAVLVLLPLVTRSNLADTNPICDAATLLLGLSRGSCLRRCQEDDGLAYSLAALALHYVGGFSYHFTLDRDTEPEICCLLSTWLLLPSPWEKMPGELDVVAHMFGKHWLDLMLPSDLSIAELVFAERPPFLPGLCVSQSLAPGMALPDLGDP